MISTICGLSSRIFTSPKRHLQIEKLYFLIKGNACHPRRRWASVVEHRDILLFPHGREHTHAQMQSQTQSQTFTDIHRHIHTCTNLHTDTHTEIFSILGVNYWWRSSSEPQSERECSLRCRHRREHIIQVTILTNNKRSVDIRYHYFVRNDINSDSRQSNFDINKVGNILKFYWTACLRIHFQLSH